MSRIPASAMLSVRGIGVADRVRTSTSRAELLEPLLGGHAEPLLLVDDDEAEVLEAHVLLSSRCVPMTMSTVPAASPSTVAACSFAGTNRDSSRTSSGNAANRWLNVS